MYRYGVCTLDRVKAGKVNCEGVIDIGIRDCIPGEVIVIVE